MANYSTSGSRMDVVTCAGGLGIELLNRSNYKVWRTCMESYLVGEDLWDVVDGEQVRSPEASAENSEALKKWKQLNAKAEFALKRSISSSLFDHIEECKSAHEIWRALNISFNQRNIEAPVENRPNNLEDPTRDEYIVKRYRDLYKAAVKGEWEAAKNIFINDHDALMGRITLRGETALHVAIDVGRFKFVKELVALMPLDSLGIQEHQEGFTALHYAVNRGSLDVVKMLVTKNERLTEIVDRTGWTPLQRAILSFKSKEVVWYLTLNFTKEERSRDSPFFAHAGDLMNMLVSSRSCDICLHILDKYPFLSIAQGHHNVGMLSSLLYNPLDFPSGRSKLAFWERWIYQLVPIHEQRHSCQGSDMENQQVQAPLTLLLSITSYLTQVKDMISGAFWTIFGYLVPIIKCIKNQKYNHKYTKMMVEIACEEISHRNEKEIFDFFTKDWPILNVAAMHGVVELITTCVQSFPYLIRSVGSIMLVNAILKRKEKVFNLFLGGMATTNYQYGLIDPETRENILHRAARLAPYPQLSTVSCPALQMQRELQWFKAVEKLAYPSHRKNPNKKGEKPREIFTKEHRQLLIDAEKWMKDTSNSCMVVSTLIATVVFAAAFTVPGGYVDGKGIPLFLEEKVFMLFAISDALALFSSTTSVLMFLSILTARYAEDDFQHALPKRLILGFTSLFLAIATMMIAFGATLYMILSERFRWIFIPIIMATSVPVALFVMLQLPLFIFVVGSTYGSGIFHPIDIW